MKKIKKVYPIVKELLVNKPHLRDDAESCTANIWLQEFNNLNREQTAFEFLKAYARHEVSPASSIERSWRLVQENHEELRGKLWKTRQTHDASKAKKEIREIKQEENPYVGSPVNLNRK